MGLQLLLVDNILMPFISLISLGKRFGFPIQVLANYLSHKKTQRGPSVLLIPLSLKIFS